MKKHVLPIIAIASMLSLIVMACSSLPALSTRLGRQLSGRDTTQPQRADQNPPLLQAASTDTPLPAMTDTAPAATETAAATATSAPTAGQSTQATATLIPTATLAATQTPAEGQAAAPAGSSPAGGALSLLDSYQSALESVYAQVGPSVVSIRVVEGAAAQNNQGQGQQQPFPFPFGNPNNPNQGQTPSEALGSGFVWDTQGDIVTNNHVIDGATSIEVTFADGTIVPATKMGNDPNSDLAVIKVDAPASMLPPVKLADSRQVKVGEIAIAIGNPFGESGTMTVGIISALGRSISATDGSSGALASGGSYQIPDIIQTDAPINPGNSGGVLVNDTGEVIGVTSAIESPVRASSGIGFAIPSATVQQVIPVLIKTGHFDHAYLGISGTTLTPALAKAMNLKADQRGALIADVTGGGPADKAGLHASTQQATIGGQQSSIGGDVITAIDGNPIKSMDDLIAYLSANTQPGQKVTLTIIRGGQEQQVPVTLGTRPNTPPQTSSNPTHPGQTSGAAYLGIQSTDVTPQIDQAMNLPADTQGILIETVQSGSPAQKAGLRGGTRSATINGSQVRLGGDVIVAIDGTPVTGVQDLQAYLQQANPGDQAALTILRGGSTRQVTVTLGQQQSGQ